MSTTIAPAAQATLDRLNTPSRLTGGGMQSLGQAVRWQESPV